MNNDRLKDAFEGCVRNSLPRLDYLALYFARVVAFNAARQLVDVEPDDARLPTMEGVPLRGPAGVTLDLIDPATDNVPPGLTVLVGWENGDPSRPFAMAFSAGGRVPTATIAADVLTLATADALNLGGEGAQPAVLGPALVTYLATLATAAGAPAPDPTTLLASKARVL